MTDTKLKVDLEPAVEKDFRQLLEERGLPSINEFIVEALKADRAEKRLRKIQDISTRMWPNGAPEPGAVPGNEA
ncbi:hypothetical protein [Cryobacterium zhongshanensis]|uniref:Uncharacterized protein n=1 Tax=Cryobacterium zhongshanensis TaxID=2928153 RepID=A0AA41QYX9_9MICO|nr:hypothetical protein [Cryobacterium zhongshanensis]MCI4659699.1 hypothetical protein [Cryobacterium zhongshanensis]